MHVLRTMVVVCSCALVSACGEKEPEPAPPPAPVGDAGQAAPAAPTTPTTTPGAASLAAGEGEGVEEGARDPEAMVKDAEAAARDALEGYMGQLRDLAVTLEGIENRVAATAKAPELRAMIDRMKAGHEELMNLPAGMFDALVQEYEQHLGDLMVQVEDQIERINTDPALAPVLGELLKQIPLRG